MPEQNNENNDNEPSSSTSRLNVFHYTLLVVIGIFIVSSWLFTLTSQRKFIFVTLTIFVIFKVYYDQIFVPYKPSTEILPDSFLVTQIALEFFFGSIFFLNLPSDSRHLVRLDHANPLLLLAFVICRYFLIFRYRLLSSHDRVDVKALTFLSATGTMVAMLPVIVVTSYNIDTSPLNLLVYTTTSLADIATLFIAQLLFITKFATEILGSSPSTVSSQRTGLHITEAVFWSTFMTIFLMLCRVAPTTIHPNQTNKAQCRGNSFLSSLLVDAEHFIGTCCRIAMLLLLSLYVFQKLKTAIRTSDAPDMVSYGTVQA